jgi:site-specific DNA recombinase
MKPANHKAPLRCAVYARVSTEHGLEQEFNSLDNQREASEAYIKSQAHEGWRLMRDRYDDGGFSSGSMERPALKKLLDAVRARRIDVIVVYKVDRLTRSLADFAKLVELFDEHQVSFVSVTQAFNTTTSMGRLTLNVLLSFAQFEREVTGERIRDKIAASKKKGIWMGGVVPLGYRVDNRALHVVEEHAAFVRGLFWRYPEIGSVVRLKAALDQENVRLPTRTDGRIQPRRRSASSWTACAASTASRSFAAARASLRVFITPGRKNSWKPGSGVWRATRRARRPPTKLRTCARKPEP